MKFGVAKFVEKEQFPKLFIVIHRTIIRLTFFLKLLEVLAATAKLFLF